MEELQDWALIHKTADAKTVFGGRMGLLALAGDRLTLTEENASVPLIDAPVNECRFKIPLAGMWGTLVIEHAGQRQKLNFSRGKGTVVPGSNVAVNSASAPVRLRRWGKALAAAGARRL